MGDRREGRGLPLAAATAALLGIAAVGSFAWGTLVERRMFLLRRVSVPVLEPGSRDIRVLQLSDLHMAPWQTGKQDWVRQLARLQPDVVINTGDNIGHPEALARLKHTLEPFAGVPGVFVHGSNDYYGPTWKNPLRYFEGPSSHTTKPADLDLAGMERFFRDLGWIDLNNAAGAIEVNGTRLEFFGVNDPHRHFDRLGVLTSAIDAMREDAAAADADRTVSIGVAHAPYQRVLDSFVTHGADVIFAGHTHGGQVCVPGFGALVTNCDIPRKQVKGLSLWTHGAGSAYLNVSAGLGTSIYAPVRFACPPEATLLTLSSRA